MSDLLNIANTIVGVLGLAYGVLSYHRVSLGAVWNRRNLVKLATRREFLDRLHGSPSERQAYLLEGVLWCIVVGAVGLLFQYVELLSQGKGILRVARDWLVGGTVYLVALYRLGRIKDATDRYDRVRRRLDEAIAKLDEKLRV